MCILLLESNKDQPIRDGGNPNQYEKIIKALMGKEINANTKYFRELIDEANRDI